MPGIYLDNKVGYDEILNIIDVEQGTVSHTLKKSITE